jgi:S1-C subfamily serine protease
MGSGPLWGNCIFDNHGKVDACPVYRDPIYDFGILCFDPKIIKYISVTILLLQPDLAKVGSESKVVGNDIGEKFHIFSGIINKLDRNVPKYRDRYYNFNTNYI